LKVTRRIRLSVIAAVLIFPLAGRAGNLVITPTTTLAAETSNNTSAAGGFVTQANGNLGATTVSKLDTHSLLYPAAQTKVFAHLVLWFGQSSHMNVGYSSTDPAQVKRQISDMISRGIDGVVMVWYGPNNAIDRAAKLVMQEAETHPGFTFAIMVDNGAIRWNSCSGCDPQHALVHDLQYVEQTYFPSPAYLRVDGRPVVTNFDIDLYYTVDWSAAKAAMASNPLFLFQHSRGFSHGESDGAYSWDIGNSTDYGMSYLTSFYKTGMAALGKETWGASYKGFNDKLASWGLNRIMDQRCGQTWLQTFSKINSFYNSTNQLAAMQLVTWNDYEEGTEIESGIDNCVGVSATLTGNSLQWKITGSEDTIDHYTVYVSSDGQSLMPLADQATGTYALDMCGYSLAAGNYKLFVQAIGKPNLKNQISAPVPYAPQCDATPAPPPTPTETVPTTPPTTSTAPPVTARAIALSASPSSVTIVDGQSGSPRITVTARSGSTDPISLSCSDLPAAMSCTFSPAVITPGSKASTSVLRVSVVRPAHHPERSPRPPHRGSLFGYSMGIVGVLVLGQIDRKRILQGLVLAGLIACVMLVSSCGGIPGAAEGSAEIVPGSYSIRVIATSASTQASTVAKITIR
jgi:hypothetical protein